MCENPRPVHLTAGMKRFDGLIAPPRRCRAVHPPGQGVNEDGFKDETGGTMLFGASYEEIAIEISSVALILNQGWRRWDLRRG